MRPRQREITGMQHLRLDRRRNRAWPPLFLASAAAGAIACGTVGQGSGQLNTGAWLTLTMQDASHGWAQTAHGLVRTDDGGKT